MKKFPYLKMADCDSLSKNVGINEWKTISIKCSDEVWKGLKNNSKKSNYLSKSLRVNFWVTFSGKAICFSNQNSYCNSVRVLLWPYTFARYIGGVSKICRLSKQFRLQNFNIKSKSEKLNWVSRFHELMWLNVLYIYFFRCLLTKKCWAFCGS